VLHELQTRQSAYLGSEGIEYIDDTLDKIKKIENNLTNFNQQITILKETNETQIVQSTNKTIKALTSVNLLILIPSIITSFFGMNVYLGWDLGGQNVWPVLGIVVAIIISIFSTYFLLKSKKLI
jgi:magnesium transporter